MKRVYRINEFAQLAGITIKALRHYDRLGLLCAMRTGVGYRVYTDGDLERLEQIVALKFIGLPLADIKRLLDRNVLDMADALRLQHRVLGQKQLQIRHALKAIKDAQQALTESESSRAPTTHALRKIIEVIEMQHGIDFLKKYYTEEAWANWQQQNDDWPSLDVLAFLSQVQRSLDLDPESQVGESLGEHWIQLQLSQTAGDPEGLVGLKKMWTDRKKWPREVAEKFSGLDLDRIDDFLDHAETAYRKKYYNTDGWNKLRRKTSDEARRESLAWFDLLLEGEKLLTEDPASERAQDFLGRWIELSDLRTGGDIDLVAGANKAWLDFLNWPPAMRELNASLHTAKIAEFVTKAHAATTKKYFSDAAWRKLAQITATRPHEVAKGYAERQKALFDDVKAALREDPGSDCAQELARRWMVHFDELGNGDPEITRAITRSWMDRGHWPAWKQRRIPPELNEMSLFIVKAFEWHLRKYFTERAWNKRSDYWNNATLQRYDELLNRRARIFAHIKQIWNDDPTSKPAQEAVDEWRWMREAEALDDDEIAESIAKAWANRRNWPELRKLKDAESYSMTVPDFERAANFLDAAVAARCSAI